MTAPDGRVSAWQVRAAVLEVLEASLPTAVDEAQAKYGVRIPAPASWAVIPDFRAITDKQSPLVIVTINGLDGRPANTMGDRYTAVWNLTVYVVIRGTSYENTGELVAHYCEAIRETLLRNRRLGGLVRTVEWSDEAYSALDIDPEAQRVVGAGQVEVLVTVDNAAIPAA